MSGLVITPSVLNAGDVSNVVTTNYTLTTSDIINGSIINTATATGEALDSNGTSLGNVSDDSDDPNDLTGQDIDSDGDEEDPTFVDLSSPNLAFAKADSYTDSNGNGIADVGDIVTYSFTVQNTGNTVVTNASINDTTIGVTNLPVVPATLNPGDIGTASFDYSLTASDIANGQIINSATVTAQTTDSQGNVLPNVSDVSDDPDDLTNVDTDSDGDFEDPTIFNIPQNGILNGLVFEDLNGDGVQNAGEPGLGGVDVVITDSNGVVQVVTTQPDGSWSVVVPSGDTTTDIDESTLPAGTDIQTAGTDPTTTTVGSGSNVTEPADGFFTAEANLSLEKVSGGVVDANGNGITDAGDTITYSFTVTNNGNVLVENAVISDALLGLVNEPVVPSTLAPGAVGSIADQVYTLTAADIANGSVTNTAVSEADAIDPNGDPLGPVSDDSDDPNNVNDVDPDADGDPDDPTVTPLDQNGILNGLVFEDLNGDGVQDAGEPGLGGVDVVITDSNGVVQVVTTQPDGSWSVVVPSGDTTTDIDESTLPAGTDIQTAGTDPTTTTVGSGSNVTEPADGFFTAEANLSLEKVSGGVVDANGNGITDAGDTITYSFTVTNNGNVLVENAVISDALLGLVNEPVVPSTLAPGAVGSIADQVYTLTAADIANGSVTNTAVSEADAIDPNGDPLGPVSDDSDDPNNVNDVDPDADGDPDDPTVTPLDQNGILNGLVFEDLNGDGVQDAGEPGLGGVDVVITDSNGVVQVVTTQPDGSWSVVVPSGDTTTDIDESTLPAGTDIRQPEQIQRLQQ
ncbi:hypothetical protein BST93_00085 [Nonlabens tegetincola]|uniref:beta strand repeat-containing protein n=1 Tax=Nonlabens tegetincola TaxID=323273 RepID=UPI000CF4A660|nr:hypothetical protein [Nonlabens tegetincola]PQJ21330.1 hypothetical protein BST93_00085 [Nonlabens tegetincola]